jgi:hypothetical protein
MRQENTENRWIMEAVSRRDIVGIFPTDSDAFLPEPARAS